MRAKVHLSATKLQYTDEWSRGKGISQVLYTLALPPALNL